MSYSDGSINVGMGDSKAMCMKMESGGLKRVVSGGVSVVVVNDDNQGRCMLVAASMAALMLTHFMA